MAFPDNVLFTLSVGAMIEVSIGGDFAVAPFTDPGTVQTILVPLQGFFEDWVVSQYESGGDQVKMSIRLSSSVDPAQRSWGVGYSEQAFVNPLVLSDTEQTFIFTPTNDRNGVSIQTSSSPPPPYVWYVDLTGGVYLNYGHSEPEGNFTIWVTGSVATGRSPHRHGPHHKR